MSHCSFCHPENFTSQLIHEFEHAYWIAAKNQYYKGYGILIAKQHLREWHDVPEDIALALHHNLRQVAGKIQMVCQPHKINLASFGNVVEHLHWHIVPRYLSDPNHLQAPDLAMPASMTPEMFEQLKQQFLR